ncbi:MAG TPA: hypothetical protein VGS06_39635 [Streptosporangiaceae bacterium]|nr:hypothetical protein [Streptosporangiaceae bacterium]
MGDGDELFDPPGEAEELDGLEDLEGLGEGEPLPDGLAAWPGCAVGRAPGALFRPTGWCRWLADGDGVPGEEAEADGSALGTVVAWSAVWAGAVRANRVAKPTAVTALSCVARQVRRERRRSPAERAAAGGPSGVSFLLRMSRDRSRARVKGL